MREMKTHKLMTLHFLKKVILGFLLVFASMSGMQAQATADAGKTVFKNYCASCHAKNMKSAMTGPALANAEANWADYPKEDLYNWIRNSQAMIAAGHPRATQLWNEYKPTVMTAFPALTDEEIEGTLLYIKGVAEGTYGVAAGAAIAATGGDAVKKSSSNLVYYGLFGILLLLAFILSRVINSLGQINAAKEGTVYEAKSIRESLTSRGFITFAIFALIVLLGYTTVNKATDLGRQQGYAPEQPINFSHETHAGLNKIECQYCHDGARRSKHAVIPAANTCMNCHSAINYGSKHGSAEITKIYASAGYDPNEKKYIEDYESLSDEDIKAIYTKFIGDKYVEMTEGVEELDDKGEKLAEMQWDGIVSSLTRDGKPSVKGPIEWVRIHNLPDHAYFNHSQHVTIGKVECQQCHGKVEEMAVVEQHSPLSMGWCINCHRQTEVKFADNDYYQSYEKYHEELASGKRDKVTVADIGGLECQKCHY